MKKYAALVLLLVFHIILLVHLRFTVWPETLSFPYLYLNDFALYKDFAHPYTPLLTITLASIYKVFGLNADVLKFFTWTLIILSDVLLYLISREILGKGLRSLLPLILFTLLQPVFEGNMLWFDLGILPALLAGVLLFIKWLKKEKRELLWGSVLLLCLAALVKQQAALVVITTVIFALYKKRPRAIIDVIIGGAIPGVWLLFWLLKNQNLQDFLFWTLEFPIKWLPTIPGYADWPNNKQIVVMLLMATPALLLISRKFKEVHYLMFVLITTLLMALPRFSLFHLQPALAIYTVVLSVFILSKKALAVKTGLVIATLLLSISLWQTEIRLAPFEDRFNTQADQQMASELKNLASSGKVFMLGPHSGLYVYANALPPKPWYDNFNWYFEIPGIQERQIEGLKQHRPEFILRQTPEAGQPHELGTYQPQRIVEYLKLNYNLEGDFAPNIEKWRRKD